MAKTNSPQEEIIKQLAEHSLAAPFVFAPDNDQRTGREPADLAWACNNSIILMWMQETKEYPAQDKKIRKRQEAIEHNLSQAKGWLRLWKHGSDLQGDNGFRSFCLGFDPKCHIILLSIIKCGDAIAQFHDDKAKELGVRACVTLPQSAIAEIATGGGTTLDILLILDYLRAKCGTGIIPEKDVLDMFYSYGVAMCRQAGIDKVWPDGRIDDSFYQATHPLLAARRQKAKEDFKNRPTNRESLASLKDVFNDINIGEFLHLSMSIKDGIDRTRNDPVTRKILIEADGKLNLYDFKLLIGFGITAAVENDVKASINEWQGRINAGTARYGPMFVIDTQSGNYQILLDKRIGPSQTELLLDQWAAR